MTYTEPEPTPADLQPSPPPDPALDVREHYENEPPDPDAAGADEIGDPLTEDQSDKDVATSSPTEIAGTDEIDDPKTEAQLDKELADSLPASDPPSGWAGPPT